MKRDPFHFIRKQLACQMKEFNLIALMACKYWKIKYSQGVNFWEGLPGLVDYFYKL